MLTLYAPKKMGVHWLLQADVKLGPDTLRMSVSVSPETIMWARQLLMSGWSWAQSKLASYGARAGQYVRLSGEWAALGPLADALISGAVDLGVNPALDHHSTFVQGALLYRQLLGEKGAAQQREGEATLSRIEAGINAGDPQAVEAADALEYLTFADDILKGPDCYEQLQKLGTLAASGNDDAAMALSACKALGSCCCNATTIEVALDADDALLGGPAAFDKIAGYASDVMTFRAQKRKKTLSLPEVSNVFTRVLSRQGVEPTPFYDSLGAGFASRRGANARKLYWPETYSGVSGCPIGKGRHYYGIGGCAKIGQLIGSPGDMASPGLPGTFGPVWNGYQMVNRNVWVSGIDARGNCTYTLTPPGLGFGQ